MLEMGKHARTEPGTAAQANQGGLILNQRSVLHIPAYATSFEKCQ